MKDFIHEFWEGQARQHGVSHAASWGDNFAIELEIDTIAQHIRDGDTVLDVGCANGYSSFAQLARPRLKKMVGLDFSAAMIAAALEAKAQHVLTKLNYVPVGTSGSTHGQWQVALGQIQFWETFGFALSCQRTMGKIYHNQTVCNRILHPRSALS